MILQACFVVMTGEGTAYLPGEHVGGSPRPVGWLGRRPAQGSSSDASPAGHQRDQEADEKQNEEDLGDAGCSDGYSPKSENSGD